jgi:hypothetical protein
VFPEDKILTTSEKFKMKKRYLFPLIYILLLALSFAIPKLSDVLFVFCESIMAFIILYISIAFDGPVDTTYIVILATVVQFFLIGCFWDYIANKFVNTEYKSK